MPNPANRGRPLSPAEMQYRRLQSGLSVEELADLLKCSPNKVAQWESGTAPHQISHQYDELLTLVLYEPIRKLIAKAHAYRRAQWQPGMETTYAKVDRRRKEYGGGQKKKRVE